MCGIRSVPTVTRSVIQVIEERKTFDTMQEAFGFIDEYFKRYHPHGYDTTARIFWTYEEIVGG
jgi:hypothetical protein